MSAPFHGILPMCLRLACAALLWVTASGLPAQAVVINVNGTSYDVQFFSNAFDTGHPNFNSNSATLTNTATAPWWGSETLATDFANDYLAQAPAGTFNVSNQTDNLAFAYRENPGNSSNVDIIAITESAGTFGATLAKSDAFANTVYAYVVPPAAIPEIDGGALAKALFILFALGAWLEARRRRMA